MDLEGLKGIAASAVERIGAAFDLAALAAAEADVAGAGSEIATLRRAMRDVAPGERPEAGRRINEAAGVIAAAVEARRIVLQADADNARLSGDAVDVTLPGAIPPRGATHLVMQVWEEITDIFVGLGYTVASGPEVETDYYNFKALNYPDAHPARLETDTLYIAHGTDPEGVLLRTQTSTVQVRYMETHPPPVYIVSPGRVYRRDTIDATHTPVFHQMEGLAVDSDITFADLKGTLHYLANEFFGAGRRIRILPNFFPFTEPSAEMHVSCFGCEGGGCRICGQTGWIELLGCGMVDPNVLTAVGYDPAALSGFAFGVGIDRLAMIRHGVSSLRYFFDPDLRVLEQFR